MMSFVQDSVQNIFFLLLTHLVQEIKIELHQTVNYIYIYIYIYIIYMYIKWNAQFMQIANLKILVGNF